VREVGRAEHASTEQLSAWLDGRAEPEEQGFLAGHLTGCIVCSNELADLRSVRDLLRALPVYLPPQSFDIRREAGRPPAQRYRRLVPLTRALGAVAAVLCVVLFSVDAMQTGYEAPTAVRDSSSTAMQISTGATLEAARAARPAESSAASRPASESERSADTASKIANAPAAPLAPAATQVPPGAPFGSIANTVTAIPTGAPARPAESAARAADASTSGRVEGVAAPPQAAAPASPVAAATSPWLSPIRLWSLVFALVAAALLIGSLVLSRMAWTRSGPRDEWSRS